MNIRGHSNFANNKPTNYITEENAAKYNAADKRQIHNLNLGEPRVNFNAGTDPDADADADASSSSGSGGGGGGSGSGGGGGGRGARAAAGAAFAVPALALLGPLTRHASAFALAHRRQQHDRLLLLHWPQLLQPPQGAPLPHSCW